MDQYIVRLRQLSEIVQCSESTIRRMERAGRFPTRVQLGPNSVGCRMAEINSWLEARRPPAGRERDRVIAVKGDSK